MAIAFSITSSPMISKQENHTLDYDTPDSSNSPSGYSTELGLSVIFTFTCVVCIFGILGNGTVIWLLGFRMKRNPFTIFNLNLAVADFGFLISSIFMFILLILDNILHDELPCVTFDVSKSLLHFAYRMSQFLLTTISIDRCVAVLCPLWYRCRRPERLSTVLCAAMWILSFLVQGICLAFHSSGTFPPLFYAFLVNAVVCLPLITVSTLILFVRFCFKSKQRQRGKLVMAILLTLFFFLILAFPLNIIFLIQLDPRSSPKDHINLECYNVTEYGVLCASLNSFVNPLLYFLVGRKKRGLCRENLKLIFRRVFMEAEEAPREELETQLSDLQKPPPQEHA